MRAVTLPFFRLCLPLIVFVLSLGLAPAASAALPGLIGSSASKPVDDVRLNQSLDQVIQTLENEKQRTDLLIQLKQLRDATQRNPENEKGGILALIRDTAENLEKRLDGPEGPLTRWAMLYRRARAEFDTGMPAWHEWPTLVADFLLVMAIWAGLAAVLRWLGRHFKQLQPPADASPSHSRPRQLLWLAARRLAPWVIAFVITLYLSVMAPDSLGQLGALVLAYVLLAGALFSSLCLIALTLLDGPHRRQALDILLRRAAVPLWLVGSLAALGDALHDPEVTSVFGQDVAQFAGLFANVAAATLSALFILRFRRPVSHLIRNQPRERRANGQGLHKLLRLVGSLWFIPFLILVGISLLTTLATADDSDQVIRRALLCALVAIAGMAVSGVIRRAYLHSSRGRNRRTAYLGQLRYFGYTLLWFGNLLVFLEIGARVLGLSLLGFMESSESQIGPKMVSIVGILLTAWLVWILTDTALQHSFGTGGKNRVNVRALTMLPLIRNVLFITIFVIASIVALANMGMNVTPLLAGAGVIGLAIGFGAQSLVADLITGLFIIIENSLTIDDYVDVGNHLGTVEGLTIRTVRLRDLDGVVHTIPFSAIKTIKNYSREFGYAMFRWPVPAAMPIDDAVVLVRDVAMELRTDSTIYPFLWSPIELQGVESFDSGQAILRFRFKTAPLRQWEVQRAFNLCLRRRLDKAGLEPSMPRMNVQLSRACSPKAAKPGA
ncbi:mechanosensitive ion channel family protein [Achromobacter sp. UMC71]|uniref:mechanosensitive ion channel family protein n=1 Tax=Achromobacter sp. UMC71 TaxID=1862320 RepID=UPI002106C8D3|nr:mechanosensitive ion channel domain-containing protein [Achromobacter sp. UMC71]